MIWIIFGHLKADLKLCLNFYRMILYDFQELEKNLKNVFSQSLS